MWYNLDFKKLAILLLPTFLRQSKMTAFVKVLVSPITTLHFEFIKERKQDLYRLAHNGQVCYLRAVLNDQFDPELRRIKLSNGNKYKRQ